MALLDDLLAALGDDCPVSDVRVSPAWAAVVSSSCGLAAVTQGDDLPHGEGAVRDAGRLLERSARELAGLTRSSSALERSIGFAAINSLLPVDENALVDLNAADLLVEKGRGKRVALVGHFPFVPRLREAAAVLDVLELRPREGDLPATAAREAIPAADVVAITASALVNGTLSDLLALCSPSSFVVVLGPTTPLSPVMFDYGVDVFSGTLVADVATVLRYVSEGASYRQMRGVRRVTMARERRG